METEKYHICKVINVFGVAPALILPIFIDGEDNYYVQTVIDDRISAFTGVKIEEFIKCPSFEVSQAKTYSVGEAAVYVLFLMDGSFYIGDSTTTLAVYRANIKCLYDFPHSSWIENTGFEITMEAFNNNISRKTQSCADKSVFRPQYRDIGKADSLSREKHLNRTELIEAAKAFGEQTRRWNPRFPDVIYSYREKDGIRTVDISRLKIIQQNKKAKLVVQTHVDETHTTIDSLFEFPGGAIFHDKKSREINSIFEFRELLRFYGDSSSKSHPPEIENIIFFNSTPTSISISSQLSAIDEIIEQSKKTLPKLKLWSINSVSFLLLRFEQKSRKDAISRCIDNNSFIRSLKAIARQELSSLRAQMTKETLLTLESWNVDFGPPLIYTQNNQIIPSGFAYVDPVFSTYFEESTEEELKDTYWIKSETLYKNIHLLCAKTVLTDELFFSLVEGEFNEELIKRFISTLYRRNNNEEGQKQITYLFLSSSLLSKHITETFFDWSSQHSDRFTIVFESQGLIVSKEVT